MPRRAIGFVLIVTVVLIGLMLLLVHALQGHSVTNAAQGKLPGGATTSNNPPNAATPGHAVATKHTVRVAVAPLPTPLLSIDVGGPGAANFVDDIDTNLLAGNTYSTDDPIDTSAVTDPAPSFVYQTERYGDFNYVIPNLTPGAPYQVRLHFADIYYLAQGQAIFDVSINGTTVLQNFDLFKEAGGLDHALARIFPTTADSQGQITIAYHTDTGAANAAAIEILPQAPDETPTPSNTLVAATDTPTGTVVITDTATVTATATATGTLTPPTDTPTGSTGPADTATPTATGTPAAAPTPRDCGLLLNCNFVGGPDAATNWDSSGCSPAPDGSAFCTQTTMTQTITATDNGYLCIAPSQTTGDDFTFGVDSQWSRILGGGAAPLAPETASRSPEVATPSCICSGIR